MAQHIPRSEMFRLNHPSRHKAMAPKVMMYCQKNQFGHYITPSLPNLKSFRVVVTTCITSWRLINAGIENGHFTHIFFDESSQAMEPEMLVPLCLASEKSAVILAGDHKQLGAVVHSPIAARHGLRRSLQERLMQRYLSDLSASSDAHVQMAHLQDNYRSHPAILKCFSKLFYDDNLVPCGEKKVTHSLTDWKQLPNRNDFPCLFHGIIGSDSFFPESGSLCNKSEADAVAYLIRELLFKSKYNQQISTNDIGVIAPFRMQVLLIRKVLREQGLGAINVGSVDDFQGKESKVIFISTVISKDRPALRQMEDSANGIGILSNPKRFNVAISRAKSLMVVVGNPFILAKKPWWKKILTYCVERRAYSGIDQANEFIDIVQGSLLNLGSGQSVEQSLRKANLFYSAERRWRHMT
eukprot:CAMPEP_0197543012 /NCGR_PEP_ID=MMETSP1318-20131121/68013_1 /TAXON_ID=552666 /ORGANISM="Partenskyella glossopodia, Strain RCC365" /LENGTH=410 /DNA_ID=CAMNT_0043102319 /DNA_START=258 /DNA_END=1490 /DNA_ORIENTATION=+